MTTVAIVLWSVVAAAAVLWIYAAMVEPRQIQVRFVEVPLPRLPEQLDGLRIAHLSDLHCNCSPKAQRLTARALAAAARQQPDLAVITGDLSNGTKYAQCTAHSLSRLRARYGVYAVLGNHDWNCTLQTYLFSLANLEISASDWQQALKDTEIQLVENTNHLVTINGQQVAIVGLGDPSCGRDDAKAALNGINDADLKIMLAHSPDALDLPAAEWPDLLLAGHTHGGQICLPGGRPVFTALKKFRKYSRGFWRLGEMIGYTNSGAGVSGSGPL